MIHVAARHSSPFWLSRCWHQWPPDRNPCREANGIGAGLSSFGSLIGRRSSRSSSFFVAPAARVAELRGCFGPTSDPARQNFSAEITLNAMSFRGIGECLVMRVDFPEPGLFPVRCQLVLSALPAPYVGGLLTTNTLTSKAGFGGETDPPGYTQASIATIRLWRSR